MTPVTDDTLDLARQDAALSHADLWLRYFALGGMTPPLEVEAMLLGAMTATTHDRDLLTHALNERFSEQGVVGPLPYSDEPGRPAGP